MIKLIVFDWDDVITIGSKEGYFKCYHETMVDLGVFLDPAEERRRILAKWSKSQMEELGELLRERPELLGRANEIYEKKLFGKTFVGELHLVEGAVELLNKLSMEYALAVATAANQRLLENVIFPVFDIPKVFSKIISLGTVADADKQKPNPYMLEEIMRIQGAAPSQTIYVGDAPTDVVMARNAKVETVVVLTGHLTRDEAQGLGVRYIADDITSLPIILRQISADEKKKNAAGVDKGAG